ncbi:MAG TPA: hypothetical protein VK279_10095 [Solirubrobacteraceae bacterium]|nr:hypothetical protein [Solirubrobacteraceae bacterium]
MQPGEPPAPARPPTRAERRAEATRRRGEAMQARRLRTEQRAAQRRAELEPLRPGERPTAVTVAAVVAAVLALVNLGAGFVDVGLPTSGSPARALPWTGLLLIAAVGMWYARYWAVLGFQAALVFQILALALALVTVQDLLLGALIIVPLLAALGFLFWKLVRAMARLQLPGGGSRDVLR